MSASLLDFPSNGLSSTPNLDVATGDHMSSAHSVSGNSSLGVGSSWHPGKYAGKAINGVVDFGKDIFGGIDNLFTGDRDYKRQKELQERQFEFNKMMASTAYQRATADMKKAGINPALAAGNISSASAASGSSASAPQAHTSALAILVGTLITSAIKML